MPLNAHVRGPGAVSYPALHLSMAHPSHIQGQRVSPAVSPNPCSPPRHLGPIHYQRSRDALFQHFYQLSYRVANLHGKSGAEIRASPPFGKFWVGIVFIICKERVRHLADPLRV